MQFTTIAALMSLAATGLATPTASTGEGIASLGLRDADLSMAAKRSEEAAVKPATMDAIEDDDDDFTDNDDELLSFNATSAADTTTIEKRKFKGGWCGLHIKDVYGDYHQADVTVFDAEGNTIRTRHKKTDKSKKLNFKFDKGLPGKASLHVQVGGVGGDIVSYVCCCCTNLLSSPHIFPFFFFFSSIVRVGDAIPYLSFTDNFRDKPGSHPVQGPGFQDRRGEHPERQLQGWQGGPALDLQEPLCHQLGLWLLLLDSPCRKVRVSGVRDNEARQHSGRRGGGHGWLSKYLYFMILSLK